MPARFAGSLNFDQPRWSGDASHAVWEASFSALPRWTRRLYRGDRIVVAVDSRGPSEGADGLAVESADRVGIAGTIRLDGQDDDFGPDRPEQLAGTAAARVLRAYMRWGEGAFSRIRGDFAFVLWDENEMRAYLVRDPAGVRRLHYAMVGKTLVFSSEVEGVLAHPRVARTVDEVTILDHLSGSYATATRTFFRDVRRVRPGHAIVATPGMLRESRYAHPPSLLVKLPTLATYAEAFRQTLTRAVDDRLPRSGPVVCHLSGGLDSASIARLAAALLEGSGRCQDLVLANARLDGLTSDEGPIVMEVARSIGNPVARWDASRPEMSDLNAPRLAWPLGRSSSAGSYPGDLEAAFAADASVLLSGVGGNQVALESGFLRDALRARHVPGYLLALFDIVQARPWRWDSRHRLRTIVEAKRVAKGALSPWAWRETATPPDDLPSWMAPQMAAAWSLLREETRPVRRREPRTGSWMTDEIWQAVCEDPTNVWALEHEDARSSEQGLEFRFPYLSWGLLEIAMSIPWSLRQPGRQDRRLQREALRGIVPERVRTRDTGLDFGEAVMRNTERSASAIQQILAKGAWACEAMVDRRDVESRLARLLARTGEEFSHALGNEWRLVRAIAALEAWLRRV